MRVPLHILLGASMKRFLTALVLCLILAAPSFAGWTRVAESVQPLQAMSDAGELRNICTTTSINRANGYWLTAAHCVNAPTFIQGEETVVVARDTELDIAVLHTPTVRVKALRLQRTQPKRGQRILMVGHPLGLSTQLFQGHISALSTNLPGSAKPYMMFDMTACGGNSGSSVVNSQDEIVSILQVGFGQGCSALTGGAPWAVLVKFIGQYVE